MLARLIRGAAPPLFRKKLTQERNGRGERIRTSGPLVPNQVRYQTAPLPDNIANNKTHVIGVFYTTTQKDAMDIINYLMLLNKIKYPLS